jgi:alcohol dehydrogenase class IV
MDFRFYVPTQVYFGTRVLEKNKAQLTSWGKRALIVTGASSAKKSGALQDIIAILEQDGIAYRIFDKVEENPSLATVLQGCREVKEWEADFIIGCGGGSPLDAGKAVALLSAQEKINQDIFQLENPGAMLPYIAIPLTAGTGSEVTPYAILTDSAVETKRNLSTAFSFPVAAFLDPRYTESLPLDITRHTAIDALSHAIEGYVSRRATPLTDHLALEAIKCFRGTFPALLSGNIALEEREKLLYGSLLAGLVIAQTGTCLVHALGYNLTYYHDIPHGAANGYLMGAFLAFIAQDVPAKTANILAALGLDYSWQVGKMLFLLLSPTSINLSEEQLALYAKKTLESKSIQFNPRIPTEKDLKNMLRKLIFINQ